MEGLILIVTGIFFFLIARSVHKRINQIEAIGTKVKGIIFSHESTMDSSSESSVFYPVVRFTTSSEEWITAKSSISVVPGMYKEGQAVEIVYDPQEPTNFFIKDRYTKNVFRIAMPFSLCLICVGLYLLVFVD